MGDNSATKRNLPFLKTKASRLFVSENLWSDEADSGTDLNDMALVTCSWPNDPSLMPLQSTITNLRLQLNLMKIEAEKLRTNYEAKCSVSLKRAVSGFLDLSCIVCKADKQVVFWYNEGKLLGRILRPIGLNTQTSAIVERKTTKLKSQVAVLEKQFVSTSIICKESLGAVQALNLRVNDWRQTSIGSTQDKVTEMVETFDSRARSVEREIHEKEAEVSKVSSNITQTNKDLARTHAACQSAENAHETAVTTSAVSFIGAAGLGVFSIFCPPVAFAAVGAAALGTGTAIQGSNLKDSIAELQTAQRNLSDKLSNLTTEIESLRDQLPSLELQKSQHSLLSEGVKFLELECLGIRQGSINLSASLLKDRDVLASARAKIDGVASNLQSVEYVRTRRQITGSLRDIMQDLGAVSSSGVGDKKVLARAVVIVRQIEMNTPKMLSILDKAC